MGRVKVNLVIHLPDRILGTQFPERNGIQLGDIGRKMNLHIHLVRVERTVGRELQHGFLEIEIASVAQRRGDAFPLFVQRGGRELFAFMHFAPLVRRYRAHRRLRNVHCITAYLVGLVRRNKIRKVDLAVLDHFLGVHFGMEIAHVVHLLAELLHADRRQLFIINHRRLTHLVGIARQAFVGLAGRVRRSRVIHMQLQFPETKYLCVLFLPQVAAQLGGGHVLVVHAFDFGFVEQVLAFRHELRCVARSQCQYQRQ